MNRKEQLELFDMFTAQVRETLVSKGNDYAGEEDVLTNFKEVASIMKSRSEISILTLIATKVSRIVNLLNPSKKINFESLDDSILDLFTYSFLLKCAYVESNKTRNKTENIIESISNQSGGPSSEEGSEVFSGILSGITPTYPGNLRRYSELQKRTSYTKNPFDEFYDELRDSPGYVPTITHTSPIHDGRSPG